MKQFKLFCIALILIVICFFVVFVPAKKNIYYEPKLYPVLDENNRPYCVGEVEEPRVELLSYTDRGIVFELVDTSGHTEPFNDTFYCILTNDRELHYYNGYIRYFISGYAAIDKFDLSDMEKKGRVFEFQVLNKEYTLKITHKQYKKILSMIDNINKTYYPTDEEMFNKINDYYVHKGLCLKTGYFDGRIDANITTKNGDKLADNKDAYNELFDEFYSYVQGLIPNLEPYKFCQK